jgi:hypothetical protein
MLRSAFRVKAHVGERLFGRAPVGLLGEALQLRNACVYGYHHPWIRPPGDERRKRGRIDLDHAIESAAGIAASVRQYGNCLFPIFSLSARSGGR